MYECINWPRFPRECECEQAEVKTIVRTWNKGESVNSNIDFLQPDHFRLWYAYCERTWLAIAASPAIFLVSMMVWCHPNLEAYMGFGYRLHSIKLTPVSFTYLEVLKLILAYTHICSKIPKKNSELAYSTARKLIVSIDVAWLRFTAGLPSSEIIKVLK